MIRSLTGSCGVFLCMQEVFLIYLPIVLFNQDLKVRETEVSVLREAHDATAGLVVGSVEELKLHLTSHQERTVEVLTASDESKASLNITLNQLTEQIAMLEQEKKLFTDTTIQLSEEITNLEQDKTSLSHTVNQLNEEVGILQLYKTMHGNTVNQLNEEIATINQDRTLLNEMITELNEKIGDGKTELADRIYELNTKVEGLKEIECSMNEINYDLKGQLGKACTDRDDLERFLTQVWGLLDAEDGGDAVEGEEDRWMCEENRQKVFKVLYIFGIHAGI